MTEKRVLARDQIIARRARAEERGASADAAEESRRVDFLLNRLKLTVKRRKLLSVAESRVGMPVLTLALFNEMLPTFPLLMGLAPRAEVSRLHLSDKATIPALVKRFQDAPFVAAYEKLYTQLSPEANGRAVTLLFSRKGVDRGFAMHDCEGLGPYWHRGFFMGFTGGTRDAPRVLLVESFTHLVDAIYASGHGWKPDFAF